MHELEEEGEDEGGDEDEDEATCSVGMCVVFGTEEFAVTGVYDIEVSAAGVQSGEGVVVTVWPGWVPNCPPVAMG